MKTFASIVVLLSMLQQAEPTPAPAEIKLRRIVATVTDPSGNYVRGLRPQDFIIEEDGERMMVARFTEASEVPVSLCFLVDASGSMGLLMGGAVGAGVVLLKSLKPQDELCLLEFDRFLNVVEDFTDDKAKIEFALRKKVVPGGMGTNLFESVRLAVDKMKGAKHRRRALVIMTDAEDNGQDSIVDLQSALREHETVVYTFALTQGGIQGQSAVPVPVVLDVLSKDSGGRSMFIDVTALKSDATIAGLVKLVGDLNAETRGQYTIGYYTSKPGSAATRVIRVRTSSANHRVRIRRDLLPE